MSVRAERPAALSPLPAEMYSLVDERTQRILDRRRAASPLHRRGWLVRRALLAADVAGLIAAFTVAQWLFGDEAHPTKVGWRLELALLFLTLPVWGVVAKLHGLYDNDEERTDHSTVDDFVPVFHLVTVGAWLIFAFSWLTGVADPNVPKLLAFWAFAVAAVPLSRAVARGICRRQVLYLQNTVIVGAGEVGQVIARKLLGHPEYGINLVGFVDGSPMPRRDDLDSLADLGGLERLPDIIDLLDVERVILAFSNESHEELLDLVRMLKEFDVQVDIVPRLFEILGANVTVHTVEGLPLLGLPPLDLSRSSKLLKRTFDIGVSTLALVLLSPLLAAIAAAIRLTSPGPAFFRQVRVGAGNERFEILKFRTMDADAEARKDDLTHLNVHLRPGGDPRMFKVPDDPRTTAVGRFLRRYSLDELPQLYNVLRGEMSLVGPRPLILDEDANVREWARQRLELKPGITGLWQSLGGSEIPFEEMVRLDYLYVTSWSLGRDISLIFRTIPHVLRGARTAY